MDILGYAADYNDDSQEEMMSDEEFYFRALDASKTLWGRLRLVGGVSRGFNAAFNRRYNLRILSDYCPEELLGSGNSISKDSISEKNVDFVLKVIEKVTGEGRNREQLKEVLGCFSKELRGRREVQSRVREIMGDRGETGIESTVSLTTDEETQREVTVPGVTATELETCGTDATRKIGTGGPVEA